MSKVVTSALAILPPPEVWASIQAIRLVHDKHVERWMPHCNMLYPFVHEDQFAEAVTKLTEAVTGLQFTVILQRFAFFEHGKKSATVFLELDIAASGSSSASDSPPQTLQDLQQALESVFPHCNDLSARSSGFHGHISVGQFPGAQAAAQAILRFQQNWTPISFVVDKVHLISRRGKDVPFEIRHVVPLK